MSVGSENLNDVKSEESRSFDHLKYKENLKATRPADIDDLAGFISAFAQISATFGAESGDKEAILKFDTMTIWLTRALQISKIHENFKTEIHELVASPQLLSLFTHICQVHDSGSGPYASATFSLLTKFLQFVDKMFLPDENDTLLSQFADTVMSIPPSQKTFFVILESFIRELEGAPKIIAQENNQLNEKCIDAMSSPALANSASKALASLYTRIFSPRSDSRIYIGSWSLCIENGLKVPEKRGNIISYLLPKLFRPCPGEFLNWVKSLNITKGTSSWRSIVLPLLNCGYIISQGNDPLAAAVLTEDDLLECLSHSDGACRRESFAVVCSAITASDFPPDFAIKIIKDTSIMRSFFVESITPESRSEFSSMFRRALLNLRELVITKTKRLKKKPDGQDRGHLDSLIDNLEGVFAFVRSQLIPDASYSQLASCTEFLRFFIEFEFDGVERGFKRDVRSRTLIFQIYSTEFAATLLRFTSNNYEDIRSQCAFMLRQCPYEILEEIFEDNLTKNTLRVLSSLKGRQSDGGAQTVKAISQIYLDHGKDEKFLASLHLLFKHMNTAILEDRLVHGHFTAFADLFSLVSPEFYQNHETQLSPIIASLLHTTAQMWDVFKPQLTLTHSDTEEDSDGSAWRSIKEHAYFLKVILNLNENEKWNVISQRTFLNISALLIDQLSNISHRGAFSAIYPTFVRICELCYGTDLDSKPLEWLQTNLKLLETKEQLISRRSAGLPYLLTAVLNSCPAKGPRRQTFFEITFSELFRVAEVQYDARDDTTTDLPQVHAFNCLKCIFRESSFSSDVQDYLEKAMEIALKYLDHLAWAIKNGAVMLFTTLLERLFGSHKSGEALVSKNASMFFNKYTSLRSILLLKLESSETVNDIFLVLSILLRLHTFSKEDKSLEPFKNIILRKVIGHSVWKIREMAARLLCAMTHIDQYPLMFEKLTAFDGLSRNDIHGRLICLLEMIKNAKRNRLDFKACIIYVENWFVSASQLDGWVNLRAALLILENDLISKTAVEFLKALVMSIIDQPKAALHGAQRLFLETATKTVFEVTNNESEILELSKLYISASHYEAQMSVAEYWQENADRFGHAKELHDIVLDLINNAQIWNHVKVQFLKLWVDSNASIPRELCISEHWSEDMKGLGMVLQTRLRMSDGAFYQKTFETCASDHSPESMRMLSVMACNYLTSEVVVSDEATAEALFMLFEKLSDESEEIRAAACMSDLCSEASKKHVLDDLSKRFPKDASKLAMSYLKTSLVSNLDDLRAEQKNPDFEIERINLFRNEVEVFGSLVNTLDKVLTADEEVRLSLANLCSLSILLGWELVKTYDFLVSSWSLNVHLDSALRKVFLLERFCPNEEKDQFLLLRSFLKDRHYYL